GFGCPWNAYECDRHCVSKGYTGGNCRGKIRQTCHCY
nr:Chain A, Arthropod defensin [Actinomyces sp. oral taxon 171 str. F0337]